MFLALLKKELLQQIQTQKFMISAAISVCLFFLSLYISTEQYLIKKAEYDRAVGAQTMALEFERSKEEGSPRDNDQPQWTAVVYQKPTPLSIFCNGIEGSLGNAGWLDPLRTPFMAQPIGSMGFMNTIDLPGILERMLCRIDFTLVVRVLFSLMAVFLAFDMITGERERGVLKLIHANDVSRLQVIAAKWLTGILVLTVSVLLGVLISLLYLFTIKGVMFGYEEQIRLGVLFLVSVLYLLVFYHVSLLISCIVRSSHMAIVSMFLLWTTCLFILPNMSIILGRQLSPIPSIDHADIERRKVDREYIRKFNEIDRSDREKFQQTREDKKHAVFGVYRDYINRLLHQRSMTVILSVVSPAPVYDFAMEYIAGTSVDDHNAFMDKVRIANDIYSEFVNTSINRKSTFYENKSHFLAAIETITNVSIENKRLPFRVSFTSALPFILWLFSTNGIICAVTIFYYDRKTAII